MEAFQLRPAASLPQHEQDALSDVDRYVIVKHPAHPDEFGQNHLFQLDAWDASAGGLMLNSFFTTTRLSLQPCRLGSFAPARMLKHAQNHHLVQALHEPYSIHPQTGSYGNTYTREQPK
jgi:hypothetical protein